MAGPVCRPTARERAVRGGESSVWKATRAGTPAARDNATNELALPIQKATPWVRTALAVRSPAPR